MPAIIDISPKIEAGWRSGPFSRCPMKRAAMRKPESKAMKLPIMLPVSRSPATRADDAEKTNGNGDDVDPLHFQLEKIRLGEQHVDGAGVLQKDGIGGGGHLGGDHETQHQKAVEQGIQPSSAVHLKNLPPKNCEENRCRQQASVREDGISVLWQ